MPIALHAMGIVKPRGIHLPGEPLRGSQIGVRFLVPRMLTRRIFVSVCGEHSAIGVVDVKTHRREAVIEVRS